MDRSQFDRIIDVGRELSGALPRGHRFGSAVAEAAAERAAISDLKLEPVHGSARPCG